MIQENKKNVLPLFRLKIQQVRCLFLTGILFSLMNIIFVSTVGAQDMTAIQNMTPVQREQVLKNLSPAQQQQIRELMQAQQSAQIDTTVVKVIEKQESAQFKGLHLPVQARQPVSPQESKGDVVGMSYFRVARERILAMENAIKSGNVPSVNVKDALSGYVGPLEMISSYVQTGTPERYYLSPGDEIFITYWGNNVPLTTRLLTVTPYGEVQDPGFGKIVARGMTLEQFEKAAQEQYQRYNNPTDFNFVATLGRLKSIGITITGEAFRPGSYSVSAVTTLFNALNACGGPNDLGSLREIKLLRGNKSYDIDFYDFLINASTKGDYALQGGDIIHISRTEKRILVEGEVLRPGIYEVKSGENLNDLLTLAGGIKSSGIQDKVFVETTLSNHSRVTRDVNITDRESVNSYTLMDEDRVFVRPIYPLIKNYITVTGNVENPGSYELKQGLQLLDVVRSAIPLEDTYMERAIVTRFHFDSEEYTHIPINLSKLLSGDLTQNIGMAAWDTLRVFSKTEVDFTADKMVSIQGCVQRPGDYVRSENMHISDLVFGAGGFLPDVWLSQALLKRWDFEKKNWILITVDLNRVLNEEPAENRLLQDRDILKILSLSDAVFIPPHEVTISGNVQRPGKYVRADSMRVRDLLFEAGGVLPGFHSKAHLARAYSNNETEIITINLDKLLDGNSTDNYLLQDQDILTITKYSTFYDHPSYVSVSGEVTLPGPYALRNKEVPLSQILQQAGGFTDRAYPKGLILSRKRENLIHDDQLRSLKKSNQAVTRETKIQYYQEEIKNRLALAAFLGGEEEEGKQTLLPTMPNVSGSAVSSNDIESIMAAGLVPGIAEETGKVVQSTADVLSGNPQVGAVYREISDQELQFTDMVRISVNIDEILKGNKKDVLLMDGDEIYVPEQPRVVHIRGAVNNAMTLQFVKNKKPEYYIKRAGGLDQDADKDRTRILRVDGSIWMAEEVSNIEQGDIIYVPTKVMSTEIETTTDKILNVIRYTLSTVASITIFLVLIEKISE